MLKKLAKTAVQCQNFVNYRCIICKRHCSLEPALCAGCLSILPWISPMSCLVCGSAYASSCRGCSHVEDGFDQRLAIFEYAFPVDALLKRFKYQESRSIGRALGQLLAEAVKQQGGAEAIDLIVPVPLAWPRRKARGFNQAADLAEVCSKQLNVPWSDRMLWRHADTPALAGLSPVERRFALLGAFSAEQGVCGKRIALVDDVMTSGATSLEIQTELSDQGAESVSFWSVARALDVTGHQSADA